MDKKINASDTEIIEEENRRAETDSHHGEESHRHHHHHHRSHHSHHRSSRKKKIKLNTKVMWAIVAALLVLLVAFMIAYEILGPKHSGNQNQQGGTTSDILSVKVLNEEGCLIQNAVSKYLLTDLLNTYNANVRPSDYIQNEDRLDKQVPVALQLSTKDGSAISYKIELADNENFADAQIWHLEETSGTHEFEHLYANTEYFYRVTAYTGKGVASVSGHFKTADTPRILSIDGLSNVRDIGNWRTDSGKRIKQGLLLRGTEMDGAVESGYHLTNEGLSDMLKVFGIKTDIDLRAQTPTSMDALGSRVEHRYYNMVLYEGIFTDEGKEKVRMVFADLANPDHYPIYLHCTYGRDRTGTVCYLLEALLGVSRGDCLKEYGLSNVSIANIQAVENGLKTYEGSTLKEQTESFLLACGVSEYQIESIRKIFLED